MIPNSLIEEIHNRVLNSGHADWDFPEIASDHLTRASYGFQTPSGTMGILQVLDKDSSGLRIRYKVIQQSVIGKPDASQATLAVPAEAQNPSFGPVIERTIETGGSPHRALNLASGDFMSPSRGRAFVFGPAGTDTLRVAGVDLYSSDDALAADNINTLDMRLWLQLSPQNTNRQPLNIDEISAEEFDQLLADWNRLQATMERTGVFGGRFGFDLRKVEPVLRGRDVYVFITRDGTQGVLQIAGVTDNPRGAKIRYRLMMSGQPASDANPGSP